ncbi:MAG: 3-deoxy-7-phosphoheptulonate synthase [Defluviitaleaceae bacterium]|nr:3-deoxy-7-phosphoheptulonate synthase [Defluviitaleaceae bacterium]
MHIIKKLPSPEKLKLELSPNKMAIAAKSQRDAEIADILQGRSDKLLLIVGPCSAHDPAAVLEYAKLLAGVARDVKDKILIIPRVYTSKPRTASMGFMGLIHEKNGLYAARKLHLDILEQTHLSCADELLYSALLPYFDDLVSYFAIGARSVQNQEHRLVASGLSMPVGMKNPTSGALDDMTAAINSANAPHEFIFRDNLVKTGGNPLAHAVLRGFSAPDGGCIQNYNQAPLLQHPVIIDISHCNSAKNPKNQCVVALDALELRKKSPNIKGLMMESFIKGGMGNAFGMSITDPCLSWPETRALINEILNKLD